MPLLTVVIDKTHAGWNGTNNDGLAICKTRDAQQCMTRKWKYDAHFACYRVSGMAETPRLNLVSLPFIQDEGLEVLFDIAALDIDHKPRNVDPSDEWRKGQEDLIYATEWGKHCALYHTKRGYRLVVHFPQSIGVEEFELFLADWRRVCYAVGVVPDPSRWNGLFRLPYVRRAGVKQRYGARNLTEFDSLPPIDPRWLKGISDKVQPATKVESGEQSVWDAVVNAKLPFMLPKTVPDGTRNTTLWKLSCSLRSKGMEERAILDILVKEDNDRCDPPLQREYRGISILESMAYRACRFDIPDRQTLTAEQQLSQAEKLETVVSLAAEREEILNKKEEQTQEDSDRLEAIGKTVSDIGVVLRRSPELPTFHHLSEVSLAKWVEEEIADNLEDLVFDQGTLRRYNSMTGVWEEIPMSELYKLVASIDKAQVYLGTGKDGRVKTDKLKVSDKLTTCVAKLVCKMRSREGSFRSSPPGIVFSNGFLRLTEAGPVLEPLSRGHYAISRVNGEYTEDSKTPLFDKFMGEVLIGPDAAAKIQVMLEFMGCSLTKLATRMQKAMLMTGGGANGKSTLIDIWVGLLPPNRVTHIPPQDMHNEYRLAHMSTSLLNAVNEAPSTEIAQSASLKAVISGDRVMGRHIRQAPFEYSPVAAQVYACNELPAFRDMTEGFNRRWLVIEWDKEFDEDKQIRGLANIILKQERLAIICKVVQHACNALRRGHYVEPTSSKIARSQWRRVNDQVSLFLEEKCEEIEAKSSLTGTSPNALFTEYRNWIEAGQHSKMGSTTFYRRLKSLKVVTYRIKGHRYYPLRVVNYIHTLH